MNQEALRIYIRKIRKLLKISQAEAAQSAGLSSRHWARWETQSEFVLRREKIDRLAVFLSIDPARINELLQNETPDLQAIEALAEQDARKIKVKIESAKYSDQVTSDPSYEPLDLDELVRALEILRQRAYKDPALRTVLHFLANSYTPSTQAPPPLPIEPDNDEQAYGEEAEA